MANKIPVGGSLARAYGFAFGNIVNNFGVTWMVVAIGWVLGYFFQQRYMGAVTSLQSRDPQAIMQAMPFFWACFAGIFVLMTAEIAALTKEALGLRTGSAFLQFPFGAAMWRLIGAYLLYFLVMIVIYVIFAVVSLVLGGVGGAVVESARVGATTPLFALLFLLAALVAVGAIIYIATRLSFLLTPVAVAERISLTRAWQLTKGNFWRIFVIVLALVIPLVVLELVFLVYVVRMPLVPPLHSGVTPQELQAFAEQQQAMNRQMMTDMQRYWYIAYPLSLVVSLIFYGMFAGASAHAYRAVTHEDRAPEQF
ncbi:MAG: hypothetical protein JOZ72_06535 [Alphaproteobacteria bacterium]|nr:hypothetical protein [Alphaproteobacteria bacterium]